MIRIRFSLRLLLILFSLCAAVSAILARPYGDYRSEAYIARHIENNGGRCQWTEITPDTWNEQVCYRLGQKRIFRRIESVTLATTTARDIQLITPLEELKHVKCGPGNVEDTVLQPLHFKKKLEFVEFAEPIISPAAYRALLRTLDSPFGDDFWGEMLFEAYGNKYLKKHEVPGFISVPRPRHYCITGNRGFIPPPPKPTKVWLNLHTNKSLSIQVCRNVLRAMRDCHVPVELTLTGEQAAILIDTIADLEDLTRLDIHRPIPRGNWWNQLAAMDSIRELQIDATDSWIPIEQLASGLANLRVLSFRDESISAEMIAENTADFYKKLRRASLLLDTLRLPISSQNYLEAIEATNIAKRIETNVAFFQVLSAGNLPGEFRKQLVETLSQLEKWNGRIQLEAIDENEGTRRLVKKLEAAMRMLCNDEISNDVRSQLCEATLTISDWANAPLADIVDIPQWSENGKAYRRWRVPPFEWGSELIPIYQVWLQLCRAYLDQGESGKALEIYARICLASYKSEFSGLPNLPVQNMLDYAIETEDPYHRWIADQFFTVCREHRTEIPKTHEKKLWDGNWLLVAIPKGKELVRVENARGKDGYFPIRVDGKRHCWNRPPDKATREIYIGESILPCTVIVQDVKQAE